MTKKVPGWNQRELNELGLGLKRILENQQEHRLKRECINPNCNVKFWTRQYNAQFCSKKCHSEMRRIIDRRGDEAREREVAELKAEITRLKSESPS